jgi:hypothetical protein
MELWAQPLQLKELIHRLEEARRTVQIRAIKGVAENQKSECAGSHTRNRGNVLIQL